VKKEKTIQSGGYSSRWGLILTLIGASVGTGNVWRFPRMAALNGGGSFVLAWTICLFAVSIPILIAEHVLGRASRHGAPGAFRDFIGKKYTWMGAFLALTTLVITGYYTVIMGWCLQYALLSFKGFSGVDTVALFDSVSQGGVNWIFFVISLGITSFFVSKKVSKGTEVLGKYLTPILFIILIVIAVMASRMENSVLGLQYLFNISSESFFNANTWLNALSQSAWSVGPGFGLVIVMGVYTSSKTDIGLNEFVHGLGDNSAALLAGFAILPALFAMMPVETATEICASGNYGLTFISLTTMFSSIPGGNIISFLFFFALFSAALTANVIFMSTGVVPMMDSKKMSRKKATTILTIFVLIIGTPSALWRSFLGNQDWVLGQALLVGTIFTCFLIFKFGTEKMRTKYINTEYNELHIGKWWNISVNFVTPILITIMFVWWTIQSIGWGAEWWNPLAESSPATFITQIALYVVILIIANNFIAKNSGDRYIDTPEEGSVFPSMPEIHKN
jgi:NSS family neurotransmitter:Na+ symporter